MNKRKQYKYKYISKAAIFKKETLEKRECLRCEKLFKPPSKLRFLCDTCNKYINDTNQNDD